MSTKQGVELKYAHVYVMKLLNAAEAYGGVLVGPYVTRVMPRILAYDFSAVNFPAPSFIFPDEARIKSFVTCASSLRERCDGFYLLDDYGDEVCQVFLYTQDTYDPVFRDFLYYDTKRGYHSDSGSITGYLEHEREKRSILVLGNLTKKELNDDAEIIREVKAALQSGYKVFMYDSGPYFRLYFDDDDELYIDCVRAQIE